MAFDLTSTQEAAIDFFHPELTNSSLSVQLMFGAALRNIEMILERKMFNSLHRLCEKRFQKRSSYELMDDDLLFKVMNF